MKFTQLSQEIHFLFL